MLGPPESAFGDDSNSDWRDGVRSRSSQHTPTFDSPPRPTGNSSFRHSTHYRGPPLPASRPSSGGLSSPRRVRSLSMNGDVPRPHSIKKSERTRRKRSSRKSGAKRDTRAIDYGLGLLDDPSFLGERLLGSPMCNAQLTKAWLPQTPPPRPG